MAQTKADRSAAAKKAAATRQRNQTRAQSRTKGKKAAATRQSHGAEQAASQATAQAKRAASGVVSGAKSAVRLAGIAAVQAGKAAVTRVSAADQSGKQ